MKTMSRTRMSADERREEILNAAVSEFALKGLHGTSTETIARRVGISQPYLFRLYRTKKDLFLAAVERGFDRVSDVFRLAAESNPTAPLPAMGAAYKNLISHREELLLQMQSYVACVDPEIQVVVQRRFAELYRFVEDVSGADEEVVRIFFAQGMLFNVAAAIDLPALIATEGWAGRCLG